MSFALWLSNLRKLFLM